MQGIPAPAAAHLGVAHPLLSSCLALLGNKLGWVGAAGVLLLQYMRGTCAVPVQYIGANHWNAQPSCTGCSRAATLRAWQARAVQAPSFPTSLSAQHQGLYKHLLGLLCCCRCCLLLSGKLGRVAIGGNLPSELVGARLQELAGGLGRLYVQVRQGQLLGPCRKQMPHLPHCRPPTCWLTPPACSHPTPANCTSAQRRTHRTPPHRTLMGIPVQWNPWGNSTFLPHRRW